MSRLATISRIPIRGTCPVIGTTLTSRASSSNRVPRCAITRSRTSHYFLDVDVEANALRFLDQGPLIDQPNSKIPEDERVVDQREKGTIREKDDFAI